MYFIKDSQFYFQQSKELAEKNNHPNGIKGALMTFLHNTPLANPCFALISLLSQKKLEKILNKDKLKDELANIIRELESIIDEIIIKTEDSYDEQK